MSCGLGIYDDYSMPPAVFVEFGFKPFGQTRCLAIIRRVTARAWHSGRAAGASARADPRSAGMFFTNPAAASALRTG